MKLENQKNKSKRQQDLEKKYLKQGFTKDEAEIKAYNRAKTETILKVAGGIALASAAAYVAYKHYDKVTDRVFEKGSKIGRLTNDGSEPTNRAFYGFVNKHDKDRYEGLYGKTLGANGTVYRKAMRAAGDINVASPESARKVLKNMFDTDKIDVEGFTKLGNDHIDSMFAKEQGKIAAHALANEYGPIGAVFATSMGAMKLVKRSSETKFVENYCKRHPESTLSNNEILKMRDRIVNA